MSTRDSRRARYRWDFWPSRQLIAEELHDYNVGPSARREGDLWIEQENVAAQAEQTTIHQALNQKLDQMLSERSTVKDPMPPAPKKKQKINDH